MIIKLLVGLIALIIGVVIGYFFSRSGPYALIITVMVFLAFIGITGAISNDIKSSNYNEENIKKISKISKTLFIGEVSYLVGVFAGFVLVYYFPIEKNN